MDEKAAKLAREIETAAAGGNIHVAQERGQAVDTGALTEEDLHSGVLRSNEDTQTSKAAARNTPRAVSKVQGLLVSGSTDLVTTACLPSVSVVRTTKPQEA